MTALQLRESASIDAASVSSLLERDLASYARPVFIRILPQQQLTGTFKLQKGDIRDAAFHSDKVEDDLYVWKPGGAGYEKLEDDFYHKVIASDAGY
jgi:citronellyl-CoA synthetase